MKKWLLIFLFLGSVASTNAFTQNLCLKERFSLAVAGSYVVTEQSKSFTFLFISRVHQNRIIIEEVTIPASRFFASKLFWRDWFEKGAPGHTSWIISQINLDSAIFEETFSFTHQGWVDLSEGNSFLTTLLNLPFHPVADKDRRRIGMPPAQGYPDKRAYWAPKLTVEGAPLSKVPFSVWKTRWPQDGSELAKKFIEIYLPETASDQVPTFFPYWIEVEGKMGSAKLRIVDSGTKAHSPKPGLPLRSFEVVEENLETEGGLSFQLKAPSYYQNFLIFAASEESFGKLIPLRSTTSFEKERLVILIPKEELKALSLGEKYHFMISSKDNPSLCLETKKTYIHHDL